MFFKVDDEYVPTLKSVLKNPFLKKITVDMGAVKFVVNGADIMRPGIVKIEDGIAVNDFVIIQYVNNKKPLAIGRVLYSSEELKSMETGMVIKNIHRVGDDIWNAQLFI